MKTYFDHGTLEDIVPLLVRLIRSNSSDPFHEKMVQYRVRGEK